VSPDRPPAEEGKTLALLSVPAGLLTALLFGVHPIHVESVAWATERKDLLCGAFFLLSLIFYLRNFGAGSTKSGTWNWSLLFFLLAMMSKPMAVTLPLVLVLLDFWPLGRLRNGPTRTLTEKIPFFVISIGVGLLTMAAQSNAGAFHPMAAMPLDFKVMNAFHSLAFYAWKMLLPVDLVTLYPIVPGKSPFSLEYLAALVGVGSISLFCFSQRKKRPYLAAGWTYYALTLIPVLGILQVGNQAAADRYTYLPGISLFLLFSVGATWLLFHQRALLMLTGGTLVAVLGFMTMTQLGSWKDSVTLWEKVVKVYPDSSQVAHGNLANAYKAAGRPDDALKEYDKAIAIPPPHAFPHDGKGTLLFDKGQTDEAIREFKAAIALDPTYPMAHRNLWFAYEAKGMHAEALAEIQEAVKLDPDFAAAYNNLAISYGTQGDYEKSAEAFRKALSLDPTNPEYLVNLATTYQRANKYDEAIALYQKGLELDATQAIYYFNLGNTYFLKVMFPEAVEMIQQAIRLEPRPRSMSGFYQKLGTVYEKSGQMELAAQSYAKAEELKNALGK